MEQKVGSPSSFERKGPFISLNSSASIGNLSSSERARARAPANHAKNDAHKGCAMQLNGITLIKRSLPYYFNTTTLTIRAQPYPASGLGEGGGAEGGIKCLTLNVYSFFQYASKSHQTSLLIL